MKKKLKLLLSLSTFCLAIAVLCFGVYAATQTVKYTVSGSISYDVEGVFVNVNTKIFSYTNQMDSSDLLAMTYQMGDVDFSNNQNFLDLKNGIKFVKQIGFFDNEQEGTDHYETDEELDIQLKSGQKTFFIVINVLNMVESEDTIWAVVKDEFDLPENILERNNGLQQKIDFNNTTKNIVIGLTVDDASIPVEDSALDVGIVIGAGDYATSERNLNKLAIDDSGIGVADTSVKGVVVFPFVDEITNLKAYYKKSTKPTRIEIGCNCDMTHAIVQEGITELGADTFLNSDYLYSVELPSTLEIISYRKQTDSKKKKDIFPILGQPERIVIDSNNKVFCSTLDNNCILLKIDNSILSNTESDLYDSLNQEYGKYFDLTKVVLLQGTIDGYIPDDVNIIASGSFCFFDYEIESMYISNNIQEIEHDAIGFETIKKLCIDDNLDIREIPFFVDSYYDVNSVEYSYEWSDMTFNNGYLNVLSSSVLSSVSPWEEREYNEESSSYIYRDEWAQLIFNVSLPNDLISICDYAFYDCRSLTSISIPNSVKSIGENAFNMCNNLMHVKLPDNIEFIGTDALLGCGFECTEFNGCEYLLSNSGKKVCLVGVKDSNLSSYSISTETKILYEAFNCCYNLESIVIPNGVKSIGPYAFSCCNLVSIDIPESVTSIGDSAFDHCYSLVNIVIPSGVTSIGNSAFHSCSSLESIDIPESVTSIGDSAFYSCYSLVNIDIPEGVTSIGPYAFQNCGSLVSIDIPESVTSIGYSAFDSCDSLVSIVIPSGVTSIGMYAFGYCRALTSIDIPNSVKSIKHCAFCSCDSLIEINFDGTKAEWNNIEKAETWIDSSIVIHCSDGDVNI